MSHYTLPIGPINVALEEPMYFKVDIEGSRVVNLEINAGHVHRGMEALVMNRNFFQNITVTERVCSLCSNSHPGTYCLTVETVANMVIPPRARYMRSLASEIKRISSHLFNVGILAHIIGYGSLFMHAMELREKVQDIKEGVFGNRMNIAANTIGGVKYDLDDDSLRLIKTNLEALKKPLENLFKIYETNPMVVARTKGVGILTHSDAVRLGVVGPVARGTGIMNDIRKLAPYSAYDEVEFDVPLETGGDVWSRAMVRLQETFQSIRIIEQLLANMPSGSTCLRPLLPIAAGEAVARTEAPRGEVLYYLRTDGTNMPARIRWRVPTYMNWEALQIMMVNANLADITLIVNSIDPCVSCTER